MTVGAPPVSDLDALRARLDIAVRCFPFQMRALRQQLFQMHVALNVTYVSPLIERISATEEIDLLGHVRRIEAPPNWPRLPITNDGRATPRGIERGFRFTIGQIVRRHRLGGVLVVGPTEANEVVGLRVLGDGVEVTAAVGRLKVETFHGYGRMQLAGPHPATIACAAIGRPVASIVGHPWLDGTNWPVVSVEEPGEARTLITFETGRAEWHRPLAGLGWPPHLLEWT